MDKKKANLWLTGYSCCCRQPLWIGAEVFSAAGTDLESLFSTPEEEGYKIISEACDLTQECSSSLWSVKSSGTTPNWRSPAAAWTANGIPAGE